jgi:hypothetical protein
MKHRYRFAAGLAGAAPEAVTAPARAETTAWRPASFALPGYFPC